MGLTMTGASALSSGRRWVPISLALVGLAALAWWFGQEDARDAAGADPQRTAATTATPLPGAPLALPRSLEGTLPDGNLQMAGGALPYAELRRLFDYYLSTQGEQSLDGILTLIRRELGQRLQGEALQAARRLLDLYLAYKTALVELDSKPDLSGNGVQAIRYRLEALHDLRARYFTEREAEGFFGPEDAYDRDAVARLEISQDVSLSDQQKQQRLASLDAAMPAALRVERDAVHAVTLVEQRAQAMREQGASADDIYRMRAQAFDAQAAARLAEVDREEAAWAARIAHYRQERTRVLQSQLLPSEREQALVQLRMSLFGEAERPRLAAYE